MALALSEQSKSDLADKLQRARTALRNMKDEGQRVGKQAMGLTLAAAGGATAGVLSIKMPKLMGTNVDTDVAMGSALAALCMAGVFEGAEDQVLDYAKGLLAAATARETAEMMVARQASGG